MSTIPLQALSPQEPYVTSTERRFTLQDLAQRQEANELGLQKARREQEDEQKAREVYAAGLNDEQTLAQLKRMGLGDHAMEYEKGIIERNSKIAQMQKDQREALKAETERIGGIAEALLGVKTGPERDRAYFQIYEAEKKRGADLSDWPVDQAPDDLYLKMVRGQAMGAKEQADLANVAEDNARARAAKQRLRVQQQLDIENTNKPTTFGSAFQDDQGQQVQPFIARNPETGKWEIRKETLGKAGRERVEIPGRDVPYSAEVEAQRERMGTNTSTTDFDRRLNLYRSDPKTYRELYPGRNQASGNLTDAQAAQIIQRIMSDIGNNHLEGEEARQYYEQQRQILGGSGISLPPWPKGAEAPAPAPQGSVWDGISATVNPPGPPPVGRKYNLGQVIVGADGKQYLITGFDRDGHPLGEIISRGRN